MSQTDHCSVANVLSQRAGYLIQRTENSGYNRLPLSCGRNEIEILIQSVINARSASMKMTWTGSQGELYTRGKYG